MANRQPVSSKSYVDALQRKYASGFARKGPAISPQEMPVPSASLDMAAINASIMGSDETPIQSGKSFMEKLSDPTSGPGKVVDVLSQPLYSASQSAMELMDKSKKDGIASAALSVVNPFDADGLQGMGLIKNLGTNNSKKTVSDILRNTEFVNREGDVRKTGINTLGANESDGKLNKVGKVAASLALDIAGDPITYIPGAAIVSVGKGAGKAAMAPVRAAQLAKEGSVVKTSADALVRGGTAAANAAAKPIAAVGRAAEKATEKLGTTAAGRATLATGRGTGTVLNTILNPVDQIISTVAKKRAAALPRELGEFTSAARALTNEETSANFLEGFMAERAKQMDAEALTTKAALDSGETLAEGAKIVDEAATDAAKIADGTFVPVVSKKNKRRIGDLEPSGPKEVDLKVRGGRKTVAYEQNLATLLRQTDNADDALMYPNISAAEGAIKVPYYQAAKKTSVADEIPAKTETTVAKVAAIRNEGQNTLFELVSRQDPKKLFGGMTARAHYAIANAPDEKALRDVLKNLDAGKGPKYSAEDLEVIKLESQEMMSKFEKAMEAKRASLAAQATPESMAARPTGGLADEGGTPAGAATDKVSETTVSKVAKASEKAKKAAARDKKPKPDLRKLNGAALQSYKKRLVSEFGIHPIHVEELLATGSKAAFERKLTKMAEWRTDGPKYEVIERVLKPTVSGPFDEAIAGVPTASEQMKNAMSGNRTAEDIARLAQTEMSEEGFRALRFAAGPSKVTQNWVGEIDDTLKWRSFVQKALRDSPVQGEGYGVNRNAANAKFQANVARSLMSDASAKAGELGLKYEQRADYMRNFVMTGLEEVETLLRATGIQPIATFSKQGWPLSMTQVIKAMETTDAGRSFMSRRVWDGFGSSGQFAAKENQFAGTLKLDAMLDAVRPILDGIFAEVPGVANLDNIAAEINRLSRKGINIKVERGVQQAAQSIPMHTLAKAPGETKISAVLVGKEAEARIAQELSNALLQNRVITEIFRAVHENVAEAGIVFGQRVNEISEESISIVANALANPHIGTRRLAEEIAVPAREATKKAAKAAKIDTPDPLINAMAAEKYDEMLTEIVSLQDKAHASYLVDIARAVEKGSNAETIALIQKRYAESVSEGFHGQTLSRLTQIGDNTLIAMNSGLAKMLSPLMSRFIPHFGNATIHPALVAKGNLGRYFQAQMRKELNRIHGAHSKEDLLAGFKAIQKGVPIQAGTPMGDAAMDLQGALDFVFRTSTDGDFAANAPKTGLFTSFISDGYNIDHVIEKMSRGKMKFPETMQFNKAKAIEDAKANGTTWQHELSTQWMKWDVEDPLDMTARLTSVMGSIATDTAITLEGVRLAKARNLLSETRREGFVKFAGEPDSVMAKYMPAGTYMHPEIAAEFKTMDKILNYGTKKNPFVDNVLSVITQKWKAGMTIYHPGHHIRNVIGDTTMAYLINGVGGRPGDIKYLNRAIRMSKPGTNIRGQYDAWDAARALQGTSVQAFGGAHAAEVTLAGGKKIKLDDVQVQRAMMERGLLPDFATQEDILDYTGEGFGSGFAKAVNNFKPAGGRVQKLAGGLSEGRDDIIRKMDFLGVLEHPPTKQKFATLEEALDYAATRIRKAHPDGSDLTGFERQMRLIFPFYSWTRKAIPLIIESILLNPGRVMIYPKAMYAWGQANGMDLESMSSPFPSNGLYPEFLTDNMTGPVMRDADGDTIGMDFGAPQADILNEFGANPLLATAGMLNPLIKMPIELATGSRLVQQSPIASETEYVDSNIPMVAQFAQLTGISPTGSLMAGEKVTQRSVDKGNKDALGEGSGPLGIDMESFINRTANMRYTNYDKPSYKNMAELEKRDKAAKEKAERNKN